MSEWSRGELRDLLERVKDNARAEASAVTRVSQALERGEIPDSAAYTAIHLLGEASCLEARDAIEGYLESPEFDLRGIALNVLTLHWGLAEHADTALRFLRDDEDEDNRSLAATSLGVLFEGTRDDDRLRQLAPAVRNEEEDAMVRQSAYTAMLQILGVPADERPPSTRFMDLANDVDWDLVSRWSDEA